MMLKRNHKKGMVLLTVLMAVMAMSIFVISILSQTMSQGSSSKVQAEEIVAEQLAKGAFWKAYADMGVLPTGATPVINPEPMNGKVFTVQVGPKPPNSTVDYQVSVIYP